AGWEECPDNVSNVHEVGDRAATEAAFGRATRVVRRRYVITRVHAQYMEARGALGAWDPGEQRYTLHADVQYPHRVRTALATNILRVPEHQIRVIAGDVGGDASAAAHVQVTSVLTNTSSTAPYRGAGRPEATYVIERLIDDAARELSMDAVDLRRKNLVPASAMPYKTATGVTYDCGDFPAQMEAALKLADVSGFPV